MNEFKWWVILWLIDLIIRWVPRDESGQRLVQLIGLWCAEEVERDETDIYNHK